MAVFYLNILHKCESVSRFTGFRLPSAVTCCTQFTTTSSNVAWRCEQYGHQRSDQKTNFISHQIKCLSLQKQDSNKVPSELVPMNSCKKRNTFLYRAIRTKKQNVKKNKTSFLEEWAKNPLIDLRELNVVALRDYEKCVKNILQSEVQQEISQNPSQCKNQQKWSVRVKVQRDWSSSKFGDGALKPMTFYTSKLAKDLKYRSETSYVSPQSNSNHMTDLGKGIKTGSGQDVDGRPSPTQLASVLLTLREELPQFFVKKHCYGLYHSNVKFVNNMAGVTTRGLMTYKMWLTSLKLTSHLVMSHLLLDILKITKHPQDSTVKVRWRIRGIPRHQTILPVFSEKYSYVDGFSVFEVGQDGLVHCHRLERVMPSSSREKQGPVWAMSILGLFGLLSRQRPAEVLELLDTMKSSGSELSAKQDIAGT